MGEVSETTINAAPELFLIGFEVIEAVMDRNAPLGEQPLELELASLGESRSLSQRQSFALKQGDRKLGSNFRLAHVSRFEKLIGDADRHTQAPPQLYSPLPL
jgi:hypothetical protein